MAAVGDVCGAAQAFCRFALNHRRLSGVTLGDGVFVFFYRSVLVPLSGNLAPVWGRAYAPIAPQLTG